MQAASSPHPSPRRGSQTIALRVAFPVAFRVAFPVAFAVVAVALALLAVAAPPLGVTAAAAQEAEQTEGADDPADADEAPVLEYYGTDTCPFCREMQPFLDRMEDDYPGLVVARYDVADSANAQRWEQAMDARGEPAQGVPTAILGDEVWVGFNEQIGADIEAAVADTPGVDPPREGAVADTAEEGSGGPSVMAISIGAAVVLAVAVALFAPRRTSGNKR